MEEENPDIICGDFNTKIRSEMVENSTNNYFSNLLKELNIPQENYIQYKERWENWIYIDIINNYLNENGYSSVYFNKDGLFDSSVKDTTAYGGIVDMIYYKKDKISLVPGSVSVVGEGVVMKKQNGSSFYTPILSDHYPVTAEFKVI